MLPDRVARDDRRRLTDPLWSLIAPLLPPRPLHRFRGHNPRIPDRFAMDSILLVHRRRLRWRDVDALGLPCSSSAVHRRWVEWSEAGVFDALRALRLRDLDDLAGGWDGPAVLPARRGPRARP